MNGWLSPRGKFYKCGISEHIAKAKELFMDKKNPEKSMEDMRWIKITPDYILGSWNNSFVHPNKITQSQINWLWDLVNGENCQGDYKFMFDDIMAARDA